MGIEIDWDETDFLMEEGLWTGLFWVEVDWGEDAPPTQLVLLSKAYVDSLGHPTPLASAYVYRTDRTLPTPDDMQTALMLAKARYNLCDRGHK